MLANRGDANPTRMGYEVADIFLNDLYVQEKGITQEQGGSDTAGVNAERSRSTKAQATSIKLPTAKLKRLEGNYWNAEDKISRKLVVTNDTLFYDRGNGRTTAMTPIAENKFLWIGPDIPIILAVDDVKNPKAFSLDIPGQGISNYKKYTRLETLSEEELNRYAGDYYSKELDATYSFVREQGGFDIHVNGEPSGKITPIMNGIFEVEGYLIIEFTDDKKEFRVAAGRVKNLRFVKQ